MEVYKITLDKDRELKYSNRAFRELEKLTGKSILAVLAEISSTEDEAERNKKTLEFFMSSKFLTDFIYCGLLHDKVTYDQAIDMIPVKKYTEIMQVALKVITDEFSMGGTEKKSDQVETAVA